MHKGQALGTVCEVTHVPDLDKKEGTGLNACSLQLSGTLKWDHATKKKGLLKTQLKSLGLLQPWLKPTGASALCFHTAGVWI